MEIAVVLFLITQTCYAGTVTKQLNLFGYWETGDVPYIVVPDAGLLIHDTNGDAVKILIFDYEPTLRVVGMNLVIECQLLGSTGLFGLHAAVLVGNYASETYDANIHSYVPAHATTDTVSRTSTFTFTENLYFRNLGVDEEALSIAFVVRAKHDILLEPGDIVAISSTYLDIYYDEATIPWGLLSYIFRWTPTDIYPYEYDPDTGSATLVQYSGGYYDESETWDTLFLHLRFDGGTFHVRVAFLYISFYTPYLHEDSCLFATPTPCGQIVHVVNGIAHVPIARSDMVDNGAADHYVGIIHVDPSATTTTTTATSTLTPTPAPQCCQYSTPTLCNDGSDCSWDWQLGTCRASRCSDIYSDTDCNGSPLGCTYDTLLYICRAVSGNQPCGTFFTSETCPVGHCTFNSQLFVCYETSSGVPCGVFYGAEACPSPNCVWTSTGFSYSCLLADPCAVITRRSSSESLEQANRNRRSNPLTALLYSRVVYGMVTPTDACCLLNETACGNDEFCIWDTQDVSTGEQYSTCRALTCLDDNIGSICEALGCCWWGGVCFNAVPCITDGDPPVCIHATDELCAERNCNLPFSCELMFGDGNNTLCHVRSGDPCSWHSTTTCPIERCRVYNDTDCVELCGPCCHLETEAHCLAVASSCVWHAGACHERECWFYNDQTCPSETCVVDAGQCRSLTQRTPCEFFSGESCPIWYCTLNAETGACMTFGAPNCTALDETLCAVTAECAWSGEACRFVAECDVTPSHLVWPIHEVCCGLSPTECNTVIGCIWHDAFGSCMLRRCFNDGSCGPPCTSVGEGGCHMGDSSLCMNLQQWQCAAPYCTFDLESGTCRDVRHLSYCGTYTAVTCPLDRCSLTNDTWTLEPQCVYSPADCVTCCELPATSGACELADCMIDDTTNRCRAKTCADHSIEDGCPGHCVVLSGNGQSPMLADCVSFYDEPLPCHKRYSSEACTSPCTWSVFAGTCAIKDAYNCGQHQSSEACSANAYCTFDKNTCRSSNECPDLLPVEPCCVHGYADCHPPHCGYNFQRNLCEPRACVHNYGDIESCQLHGGCQFNVSTNACGEIGDLFCDLFVFANQICPEGCRLNETLQFCQYPDYARPICAAYSDLEQCVADGCGTATDGELVWCITTCDTPFWPITNATTTTTTTHDLTTTPIATTTTTTTTTHGLTTTPIATPTPCCEYDMGSCDVGRCSYNFVHGLCEPTACVHHATNSVVCLEHGGCHMLPVYNTHLCAPTNTSLVCNVYLEDGNCPEGCVLNEILDFCTYPSYTVQICGVFSTQQVCESFNCTWLQSSECVATCSTPPAGTVVPPNTTTVSTTTTVAPPNTTTVSTTTTTPAGTVVSPNTTTVSTTTTTSDEQTGVTSTETSTAGLTDIPYIVKTTSHNLFRIASFVTIGCAVVVLLLAAVFWTKVVKSPHIISIVKRTFS